MRGLLRTRKLIIAHLPNESVHHPTYNRSSTDVFKDVQSQRVLGTVIGDTFPTHNSNS